MSSSVAYTHTESVKPSPPPMRPVREVAVRYERLSPVKAEAPSIEHGGGGGVPASHHVRMLDTSGGAGSPSPSRTAPSVWP